MGLKFSDFDKSDLLKATDVPQAGWELTISGFDVREFKDETKAVVAFNEIEKSVPLNVTRRRQLEHLAAGAEDMDVLIGAKIIVFQATALFQGNTVPSIQFRSVQEGAVQPQPAAPTPPKPPKPPTPAAAAAPAAPA